MYLYKDFIFNNFIMQHFNNPINAVASPVSNYSKICANSCNSCFKQKKPPCPSAKPPCPFVKTLRDLCG